MRKFTQNLLIAEVRFPSGFSLSFPPLLPGILQVNRKPAELARLLEKAMEKSWMENGNYKPLLSLFLEHELQSTRVDVKVAASAEGGYPEMTLDFDLFYCQIAEGQWLGFLPVPGIECSGKNLDGLVQNARANIVLEFVRSYRLNSVLGLLPTQWHKEVRMHTIPVTYPVYTFSELEGLKQQREKQLLERVASPLEPQPGMLHGLDEELEQLISAMKSKGHNSVLIQAGSGKGKTELVREMVREKDKSGLESLKIYQVTAGQLLHRLTGMGHWQEYLAGLCRELREEGLALYLPNFAELFEVGQYSGNDLSMAEYLRPYLARGEITLISECTPEEAARIELRSPGYLALMQVIKIREMDTPQLQEVVWRKAQHLGQQYEVEFQEQAVKEMLRLQQWFTPYSGLPGKTVAFVEALALAGKPVDKAAVYQAFCQETGLPEFMVNPGKPLTFEQMEQYFHANIYGQDEAIQTLAELMFAIKAAVIKRGKPLASLLFVGPTGVGKTELAKVLAAFLFGSRERMLRFDMSEYADLPSVLRLTGDSRGGEGLLTATVRQNPFSVILFDELEKVHGSFYDLLLQILGEGRLTDARGRVADFCSTIIIMTSNIGARAFQIGSIGFGESQGQRQDAAAHFQKAVQDHFRPELFNRLDRIVAFAPLDRRVIRQIVDREVALLRQREGLKNRKVQLEIDPEVLDYLGEAGYNALYGARHLQRTLRERLLLPLAERLNAFPFHKPLAGKVSMAGGELLIELGPLQAGTSLLDRKVEGSELRLQEFLEQVSRQRRRARSIVQGPVYNQVLSTLFSLRQKLSELKKKNKEHQFWSNDTWSRDYHYLTELESGFNWSLNEIDLLEEENLLALSGEGSGMENKLWERYQDWHEDFQSKKIRLLSHYQPQYNSCILGIYGSRQHIYTLVNLYLELGKALEWSVEVKKVWHNTQEGRDFGSSAPGGFERGKDLYLRSSEDAKNPGGRYLFVGLELQIKGEMPFLYLQGEEGVHAWVDQANQKHKYLLRLSEGKKTHSAPPEVFRQQFFTQPEYRQVRREYAAKGGMKDEPYRIQSAAKNVGEVLKSFLDTRFVETIDNQLLS